MKEPGDYKRYLPYCRTKHVVPLNWDYYAKRFGWREGFRVWRERRKRGASHGFRPVYFPARRQLPWEFIRLDPWEMSYLFLLAAKARLGIVEVGRYNGGSTLVLSGANLSVPIHSIDVAPRDDDLLRQVFERFGCGKNTHLLVGDSQGGRFPEIADGSYDLGFIDGDHSYEGCLADMERWWPGLAPGGSLLLHDCYLGSQVQEAVENFLSKVDATVVLGPDIPAAHWLKPEGSLAHLRKPAASRP